ncbi:hypothetical protein IFM89_035569 [Coptis chinensis]|uniref:Secoisolariciresinol dehydrogenase n=1 Tax=Coptis chinensis TaxID=261450 RepID=A0A835HZ51_9MAGN|nr:hypothetical protein IFM89_035569 [Coptis chinensis]
MPWSMISWMNSCQMAADWKLLLDGIYCSKIPLLQMRYSAPLHISENSNESVGLPGRVFLEKVTEWTPEVSIIWQHVTHTFFSCKNRNLSTVKDLAVKNLKKRSVHTKTGRLEDKVALITGAASGIGKATATEFINNGAKVVLADLQDELGQQTASELGPNAAFISCNVTQESDVSAAVDYTVSKYGQLDIMFNNVGISGHTPPSIVDLNLADFDRVMNINTRGAITGVKHASRVMIPRRHGCILCTASITGILGGLAPASYSVSKFAVLGIVKSVAAELSKYGIRVNCISPFAIPTPFVMDEMVMMFPGVDPSKLMAMVHGSGELEGATCEAQDIAKAALYLASDDAKYVSGHNLVVDGGFTSFKHLKFPTPEVQIK